MAQKHYYLLAALPHLGSLGDDAPLTAGYLLQSVIECGGPRAVLEAILLSDDLLQRDALLAGELDRAEGFVLTESQLRDDEPLPEYLAGQQDPNSTRLVADKLWDAYFRHVAATARRARSKMLADWVGAEVALRNSLAAARAQALGLDVDAYVVAEDLADDRADFAATVNEWSAAPDPLAGLRVVDRARWAWLQEHEARFSFTDDELAVYAARLMLLQRWQRLEKAAEEVVGSLEV